MLVIYLRIFVSSVLLESELPKGIIPNSTCVKFLATSIVPTFCRHVSFLFKPNQKDTRTKKWWHRNVKGITLNMLLVVFICNSISREEGE